MNAHVKKSLSPQQRALVEWAVNGAGSVFAEAVAGAGKTTTLIQLLFRTTGSVAFVAFNKKIVEEIRAKVAAISAQTGVDLAKRVRIGTFHSFGLNALRRVYPDAKSGPDAVKEKEARSVEFLKDNDVGLGLHSFIFKLVGLAKQRAIGLYGSIDDDSQWYSIIDHFDLAYEIEDEQLIALGVASAKLLIRKHIEWAVDLIDFDDMIYLPVVTGLRMWENDWVLTDEAQDTNPARRAMVRKMLRRGGRAVFVGDRHQSIFGFTGADNDAVEQIIRDFRCTLMPLTTSFRCPRSVVEEARKIVSHIEAHETAPEGSVTTWRGEDFSKMEDWKATDAILCRNTKPLIETAYGLIRRGVPCHVEGRDIGMGLLKLASRWAVRSMDALHTKLDRFVDRETQKLIAKGKEVQAEALKDRVDTLKILMEGCQTLDDLRAKINSMFQDSEDQAKPTLTLSTVHKSKGREWPRVFVLGYSTLMPSPFAKMPWQVQQEDNLKYVAVTRSQDELVLVD